MQHNRPLNHHPCNVQSVAIWVYWKEKKISFWYSGLKGSILPFWIFFFLLLAEKTVSDLIFWFKNIISNPERFTLNQRWHFCAMKKQEQRLDSTNTLAINIGSCFAPLPFPPSVHFPWMLFYIWRRAGGEEGCTQWIEYVLLM